MYGHRRRDVAPFGLGTCQEEDKCISNYDYSMGNTKAFAEYLPSTTLASGNTAPAAGASDSAWGAGVDSSAGGVGFLLRHRRRGFISHPGQIC
jgi:hypothetical protein